MAGNTFGQLFRLTTFGESHGPAIGLILDGCPAGLSIAIEDIQHDLNRRRPGQSDITTPRKESDQIEILSGIKNGIATGTPIAMMIFNRDTRSEDYDHLQNHYRPSHADFTYDSKYGIRDHRGGGRSSARETVARVAAGAVAKQLLKKYGAAVKACVSSVGSIHMPQPPTWETIDSAEQSIVRCPDIHTAEQMIALIRVLKEEGDSTGGIISLIARGVPAGWGEPVFDKLQADLGKAMLSINAVKGFEYGSGFYGAAMRGSNHNDLFETTDQGIQTKTNHSGGIQGGISNGMDITCRIAFKPVATILQDQETINKQGEQVTLEGKGRHDPCVVPRAVPIVEAMAALVLADHALRNQTARL